jgi:hypothetical protein
VARFFLTLGTSNYNGRPEQKLGTVKKKPLNFVLFFSVISNFVERENKIFSLKIFIMPAHFAAAWTR